MTTYAFIPARGGSERIPLKNLAEVGGRSLVRRAIEATREPCPDAPRLIYAPWEVIVSTDSSAIAEHVGGQQVTIHRRPANLAGPRSQIEEAVVHWMHRCDPVLDHGDVIVLIQPTSPFRKLETVRRCVELVRAGYDSATTVTLDSRNTGRLRSYEDGTPNVLWNRPVDARPRSQDARKSAIENGVCWAFTAEHFRRGKLRMGGRAAVVVTSWLEAFEIDTPEDLEIARALVGVA